MSDERVCDAATVWSAARCTPEAITRRREGKSHTFFFARFDGRLGKEKNVFVMHRLDLEADEMMLATRHSMNNCKFSSTMDWYAWRSLIRAKTENTEQTTLEILENFKQFFIRHSSLLFFSGWKHSSQLDAEARVESPSREKSSWRFTSTVTSRRHAIKIVNLFSARRRLQLHGELGLMGELRLLCGKFNFFIAHIV